ncbi:MAG: transporter substrate-binding domain-containing protein [Candidatus Rokubacteria bacterium]|nr:transporter substrate-binding domain-containing protein [Candidatus Rokubacteria bacterium]
MRTVTSRRALWRSLAALVLVAAVAGPVAPLGAAGLDAPAKGKSKTIDRIREQKALRAGIALAPPWLGQDPRTNEYFGAAYEIGQRLAKLLDVELRIVPSGWDVIIAGLQGNQFELALAPLFASEKRRQVVDFVNYTESGTCYGVLKDGKLDKLEDLDSPSVTFGTWTGTGTEHGITKKYTKAKTNSLVQPIGGTMRIEDVLTKRIDVAPFDAPKAFLVVHQYPQVKILPGGPEYCVKNPDIPYPIGMAFNYGDPELKKFLEAVVADMKPQIDASIVKYSAIEYMLRK